MRKSLAGAHLTEDKYPKNTKNSKSKEQDNKESNKNVQKKLLRGFFKVNMQMANIHFLKYSASLMTRAIKRKNILRFFSSTAVRKAPSRKQISLNIGKEPLFTLDTSVYS